MVNFVVCCVCAVFCPFLSLSCLIFGYCRCGHSNEQHDDPFSMESHKGFIIIVMVICGLLEFLFIGMLLYRPTTGDFEKDIVLNKHNSITVSEILFVFLFLHLFNVFVCEMTIHIYNGSPVYKSHVVSLVAGALDHEFLFV